MAKGSEGSLRAGALEVTGWLCIAGGFLWYYIARLEGPTAAALPHLKLYALALCTLVLLRAAAWRWLPDAAARLLSATLCASLLLLVSSYYALAMISLHAWGMLITWPLVRTYAVQSGDLLRSLDVAPAVVILAMVFVVAALIWLFWMWPARRDAFGRISRRLSKATVCILCVAGLGAVGLQIWNFANDPPIESGEPLSLSLFPERSGPAMQHHRVAGSAQLDAEETRERAQYHPNPNAMRRNVVVLIGDALRADRMGAYGYSRPTTPSLEALRLRHGGLAAQRTVSVCGETTCGLLALMYSKYPQRMTVQAISLQEVLRRHGYRIRMILAGDHTNFYGLREAYGPVDSYFDASTQTKRYLNDDAMLLDHVVDLPAADPAHPTMFQFHFKSTHPLGLRHPESMKFSPAANYSKWLGMGRLFSPDADQIRQASNYYDDGVVQFDAIASALLDQLGRKGYLENAIVVVVGDHGEMLGEHGLLGHSNGVFQPVLNVPFILMRYGYDGAPLLRRPLASQVDVAPTVLRELDMPAPSTWQGSPLQQPQAPNLIPFQEGRQVGVFDLRAGSTLKYWRDIESGREFVFDLQGDPGERRNLLAKAEPSRLEYWRSLTLPMVLTVDGP